MTTEDDFQRALDASPDDWQTRLVFADFLEERGDPRAEGYRALGVNRRRPWPEFLTRFTFNSGHPYAGACDAGSPGTLPNDWYRTADPDWTRSGVGPFHKVERREAEDAAALAFAKLPAERRAELLAGALTA
jgi:uncharacterized protein (TIGR02996 family)